jgi:hypothetical protein
MKSSSASNTTIEVHSLGRADVGFCAVAGASKWNFSGLISAMHFFFNTGRGLEDPGFTSINVAGTKFYRKPLIQHSL